MSYYRYRTAPKGGFGSFLGKIGGTIAGFATGGIGGAIAGHKLGGRVGGAVLPGKVSGGSIVPTKQQIVGGVLGYTTPGALINTVGNIAGALGYGPGASSGTVAMTNGQCPVGYHPNKQKSAKGEARSYCVRNRSMNPANGRAIGRAATRIKKGAKQYARVLRILGKKTGRMVPRGRKRS